MPKVRWLMGTSTKGGACCYPHQSQILVKLFAYSVIIKGTSGFTSYTLLIRFPIMLSVYIVYRMHKVERRMVNSF